jgi:protein SCO1/2
MSLKSRINPLLAGLVLGAAVLPAVSLAHIPIPPKEPGEIGRRIVKTEVADFTLTDQNGKPFQLKNSRGKIVLVTFIFTTCPDVCPLLTAKFAAVQRTLEQRKFHDYQLVSITTDPERDQPAALKKYAGNFKADSKRWSFLTGSRAELAKVWKIFQVHVTRTQAGDVNHTSLTTLIDRKGQRRVDYYGDKWQDKEILKDIEWLASER